MSGSRIYCKSRSDVTRGRSCYTELQATCFLLIKIISLLSALSVEVIEQNELNGMPYSIIRGNRFQSVGDQDDLQKYILSVCSAEEFLF